MEQNPKEDNHKVRLANILDIEEIVTLIMNDDVDIQNNLESFLPKDRDSLKDTFFNLLGPDKEGIAWVSTYTNKEGTEKITGLLALRLESVWWSRERYLVNILFYVNPYYRGCNLAKRLLDTGIEFATMSGFPFVASTFQYTDKVNILEKYFERKGFDKLGSVLIYTGDTASKGD